ncbi:maleylpyruvate isomerase family mycothiol-dependent enzyme [Actinacidiphila rubida]|uniref:TIGR03083 family protein n=1 Tax=Actinacidiphila rubida TaxID=310780 RepID=A0A1H8QF34_9ACTN|nr:maleylpyruvate isomerase family mycothiol-dependent enzyme [Actinacidiphila rubida]SEO52628.1 TIGR03083 family protein [Actinacidiphila rubida]
MDTDDFITTLRREGRLLADAAQRSGLDAPVPSCPQWQVRDLLRHVGAVHRWAAAFVAERRTAPVEWDESAPGDAALLDWYRALHSGLADTLAGAPADTDCWTFLPAPSPLAFWARRQAHETTIHRIDAQSALGAERDPVDTAFASDGLDELLTGFHVRKRSRVRTNRPRSLRVLAADHPGGDWLVHLSAEPPVVERAVPGAADCTLSGPATALYLALWNRGPYDGLSVEGDGALVELWQRTSAV